MLGYAESSQRVPVRRRDADAHRAATDFDLIALRFGVLPFFSNDYGGATPAATSTAFGWGFHYRRAVYRQRAIRKENENADLEA